MHRKFCKNHYDRIAHFRCYYCKESICAKCRLHLAHHYFCSYPCFLKHKLAGYFRILRKKRGWILGGVQLLLLLLILGQFFYFKGQLNRAAIESDNIYSEDSLFISRLSEFFRPDDADFQLRQFRELTTQQHLYQINLPLKRNGIVNIWRNGKPVISRPTSRDRRQSLSIPLTYGRNELKILLLDEKQTPYFTDKIIVDYRNPRVELFKRSVEQGHARSNMVCLTFDGGSDNSHTDKILDILKENRLQCTLFLSGTFIEKHPQTVRRMIRDGHEIANHTYGHPHLTTYEQQKQHHTLPHVTREYIHQQLLKTDSLFYRLTGQHMQPFWRAPYGEYNQEILTWAAEAGYLHIRWTNGFDTFDWVTDSSSALFRTPEETLQHIIDKDQERPKGLNGVIMLMHLGSHREDNHIFEILPSLIDHIEQRGYVLGRISDLLTMN